MAERLKTRRPGEYSPPAEAQPPAEALPLAPTIPPAWPAALPGLGDRQVIAFSPCADCTNDPPADEVIRVGAYEVTVPGPRGTFVAYGDLPICRHHARARAEAAR